MFKIIMGIVLIASIGYGGIRTPFDPMGTMGYFPNPYTSSGLIVWLDGKYNAGVGKTDSTVSSWHDLSGKQNHAKGYNMLLNGYYSASLKGYVYTNAAAYHEVTNLYSQGINSTNSTFTIECYSYKFTTNIMFGAFSYQPKDFTWANPDYWSVSISFPTSTNTHFGHVNDGGTRVDANVLIPTTYTYVRNSLHDDITYIDGVPKATNSLYRYWTGKSNNNLWIGGAWRFGDMTFGNRAYNGVIRSIRVYNRELNSSEILQNANADKYRFQ